MRLLYTLPDFWPHVRRGSERIVHDLSMVMAARGHDIRLVTRAPEGGGHDARMDGFDVAYRRPPRWPQRLLGWESIEAFALNAAAAAARSPADVLHAFYPSDAFGMAAVTRVRRRPFILSWHGYPDRAWWREAQPRLHRWFEYSMARADCVTVMAERSAERMREDWGIDPLVMPPGLFTEDYALPRANPGHRTIVCAAALDDHRKKVAVLVRAFGLLAPREPDLRLLLVGPGETTLVDAALAQETEAVADRVTCLPPTAEMAPIYASATVGALTSYQEAYGMVVLEYMASGMPAVVSDDGGSPELITPGAGVAFEEGNAEACAAALEEALRLAELPGTEEACRRQARRYDWSERVLAYEAMYRAHA
ncbi:MAG: phosphatidyl-myo-inositol alpha-mannosyltransferase [Chloroflexota bacterium]|jgi:phosphatidylinositol alpha-mannosyltransferase|nr:phosphatidyl-myo-inositol alpha-mannosyltransferase [Chloroflexota bacterium]